MLVKYEELITKPMETVEQMFSFAELPLTEKVRDYVLKQTSGDCGFEVFLHVLQLIAIQKRESELVVYCEKGKAFSTCRDKAKLKPNLWRDMLKPEEVKAIEEQPACYEIIK